MADIDPVTHLRSRGTMDSELSQNLCEAAAKKRPLSVIMADIDHFKRVNDTHGHQKGDSVLAEVAARIASVAEGKGLAYRYGGEELVVLLGNHSTQEAIAVAERMRRELESAQIAGLAVTASFGVSTFPEHGGNSAEVIKAADTALYDAKNRGRNLVRVFGEPEPAKAPRQPERKLPVPGSLTERQKDELRKQYFRSHSIRCPEDDAALDVQEITQASAHPITRLLVWCKLCGLSGEL